MAIAEAFGHARPVAILAGALSGPVQIVGRMADIVAARHVSLKGTAIACMTLMLGGVIAAAAIGDAPWGLFAFVALYGVGSGALTIVRSALPAQLFPERFAIVHGRFAALQGLAIALGPLAAAAAHARFGPTGMLWMFGAVVLVALAVFSVAAKLIRRSNPRGHRRHG